MSDPNAPLLISLRVPFDRIETVLRALHDTCGIKALSVALQGHETVRLPATPAPPSVPSVVADRRPVNYDGNGADAGYGGPFTPPSGNPDAPREQREDEDRDDGDEDEEPDPIAAAVDRKLEAVLGGAARQPSASKKAADAEAHAQRVKEATGYVRSCVRTGQKYDVERIRVLLGYQTLPPAYSFGARVRKEALADPEIARELEAIAEARGEQGGTEQ